MVVKAKKIAVAAEKRGGRGRGVVEVEETMSCNDDSSGGGGGMRKGPWTEQEDVQLVWFVRLFGERRWDLLAKVSGLKRTGKSCRLRWVNYLHPSLKRGRITADEERLILQLHAQWGSRWSRIARKLPGRTDNEIKNYWRTHMRKKAQEEKKKRAAASASPSSSSSSTTTSCSASLNNGTSSTSSAVTEALVQESSSGDEAEAEEATTAASQQQQQQQQPRDQQEHYYIMDQLWNEIAAAEAATSYAEDWGAGHVVAAEPASSMPSPVWEFSADFSLWRIDDEEYYKKMLDAS